ncbi:MAG: AMP-binding protein [bacterium]
MAAQDFGALLYKSQQEIRELQNERLARQVARLALYSPHYRRIFKEQGIQPDRIRTVDDLEAVPLLYKKEYMKDPQQFRLVFPPDAPVPVQERILWNVHYTTGTTSGQPSPFFSTTHDYFGNIMQLARTCQIGGITAEDTVANIFPLTTVPHIGFLKTIDYSMAAGAKVVCALTGSPYETFPIHRSLDHAVDMVERQRATLLSGITSFVRRVIMRAEEQGRDYSSVRRCLLLGEATSRGMREDMKRRLTLLGARRPVILSGLGFTEMQGTTLECAEGSGMHLGSPDLFYFEVCDESTGRRLADGERGLLVVSHLNRTGTCFLRYVVGDLTAIVHDTCPLCGRKDARVVVQPIRTMELVKLKGTLINPDILREELSGIKGVEEYQIVFTKEDVRDALSMDKIVIKVAPGPGGDPDGGLVREVKQRTRAAIEMTPEVRLVDKMEIFDPSATLKCQRVVDERPPVD